MIAQIVPAVSPAPPARASQTETDGDEADFVATLDEKRQKADGDTPKAAPAVDGGERPAQGDNHKKRSEEGEAVAQPAIPIPIPLAVPDVPGSGAGAVPAGDALQVDAPQQRLQQLVATAASAQTSFAPGEAAPQAALVGALAGQTEAMPVLPGGIAPRSGTALPESRPAQKNLSAIVHGSALKGGEEAGRPGHGEAQTAVKAADAAAGDASSAKPEPQMQADAPPSPALDNRFAALPDGALRVSAPPFASPPEPTAQAAGPLPTPTLAEPLGTPAWQQALSHQLSWFKRSGIHNAELRLHPEELGAIQVNLRLNNDRAQMHFITGNHQVRAALEAALPHLRTSLAESGIELGHGSVGSEAHPRWEEGFASGHSHSGERGGKEGSAEGAAAVDEVEPRIIHQRVHSNEINTFI